MSHENKWQWQRAPELTLSDIFSEKDQLCFLVGSGVSLDPPSCLPTGFQFTEKLLEKLIPKEEHQAVFELMNPEREGMQGAGDFLRFEQLIGYLHEEWDPDLTILAYFEKCNSPNDNHFILAHMLMQGCAVFTTNFDNLLEHALLKSNIRKKDIFPVINREEWEGISSNKGFHIYKLHGSITNIINDQDTRASVKATIKQIAHSECKIFRLEAWKHTIFNNFLQEYDLVILGYSGVDDFDILPSIWSISSSRRLLWIRHSSNCEPSHAQIEVININNTPSSHSDRISRNLLEFGMHSTRQPSSIIQIKVHAGKFLKWLSQKYGIVIPLQGSYPSCSKSDYSLGKFQNFTKAKQWFLTGYIFGQHDIHFKSEMAFMRALDYAREANDKCFTGRCFCALGDLLSKQGRSKAAQMIFFNALSIFDELKDKRNKSIALNGIATIFHDEGNIERATEYYQKALEIAEQEKSLEDMAAYLNNIGLLYFDQKRFDLAMVSLQKALGIDRQMGDLYGQALRLNNIGLIHYAIDQLLSYGQKPFETSKKYFQETLQIQEQLGHLYEQAKCLINLGGILDYQNLSEEALEYYEASLKIARSIYNSDLEDILQKAITRLRSKKVSS